VARAEDQKDRIQVRMAFQVAHLVFAVYLNTEGHETAMSKSTSVDCELQRHTVAQLVDSLDMVLE
jgi:hypothetical protein